MIRFSAALVAVAIGVLIGGIATSKLLLVYIAIVVSAVALLALAVGVVVKREELFGEVQGLVPAGAGAAPVQPARTGESQDQPKPVASVPPSALFQGPAAGYGSAFDGIPFGGTSQAAPPPTASPPSAANPSAPHQAPDGPGRDRVADPAPPWEAQSARDQWSSSPRPGSTTADPAPDWMPSGRAASDPVGQAPPTAPSPAMLPGRSAPSGPSSAGPEPAAPNWFAPKARRADAAPEAPADAATAVEDEPGPGVLEPADAESVPDDPEPGSSAPEPESAELDPGPAEPQAESASRQPPSAAAKDPAPEDDLVAVLRGVPRYHQPDCILIRFMPEGDVQRLTAAQAKADGCTPCAACQPSE